MSKYSGSGVYWDFSSWNKGDWDKVAPVAPETPGEPNTPKPDGPEPDSAWLRSCYICGRDLFQIPDTSINRRYRVVARDGEDLHGYVLSFCRPCSWSWLL